MGKINKKRKTPIFLILLLSLSLILSGCSHSKTEEKQETAQSEQKQEQTEEKKETSKEEIPSDLLPGQDTDEQTSDDGSMEIVEEDGKVYTTKKSSDSRQSGENSGKNNGNHGEGSQNQQPEAGVIQISFSVESSKADGSVSYSADMTLDEGSTVYDALAASGIQFSGQSYISEIGGLGEKLFGSQSGWKYYVNGSAPGKSCNKYVLKNGDIVQWKYVLKI